MALDRSRLTMQNMIVGTVLYMAPEQARGSDVTAKADLYSLGCTVYEMIAGRPPFLGENMVAVIQQQINTPPTPLSQHNSRCPNHRAALVLRLLAKDPAERPESAGEVLASLESIHDDPAEAAATKAQPQTEEASPTGGLDNIHNPSQAQEGLSEGAYIGRQNEMGKLKEVLDAAISGKGKLVTLVGEPGTGKTRTAQELSNFAEKLGVQVLWGRCYEGEGVPLYWPWIQCIRTYARDTDPEQLRSAMGAEGRIDAYAGPGGRHRVGGRVSRVGEGDRHCSGGQGGRSGDCRWTTCCGILPFFRTSPGSGS